MAKTKNYGVRDILDWKFELIPLSQEWIDHLGELTEGFRILIEGNPKNGKTEYMVKFIKELAVNHGKVNLNSTEQGKSSSLRKALLRNKIQELPAGKFMLCDKSQRSFDVWFKKLQSPNSGKTIVLDSADYMNLTFAQYKQLIERFPNKNIIIVCWKINPIIKSLMHTMDAIIEVKDFVAKPISREGGYKNFIIWDRKNHHKAQQSLF